MRWTTSNTTGSIDIDQLLSMHEEGSSDAEPLKYGRRVRRRTRRYAPPKQLFAADRKNANGRGEGKEQTTPPLTPQKRVPVQAPEKEEQCAVSREAAARLGQRFAEGDEIWVEVGNTMHLAEILAMPHDEKAPRKATVRWTTSNEVESIDMDQLLPMNKEEIGAKAPSKYSRRERKSTRRYTLQKQLSATLGKGVRRKKNLHPSTPQEHSPAQAPKKTQRTGSYFSGVRKLDDEGRAAALREAAARPGRRFAVGDNVWFRVGEAMMHPAVVAAVPRGELQKVVVRWTTSNRPGLVDIHRLVPMYEEEV